VFSGGFEIDTGRKSEINRHATDGDRDALKVGKESERDIGLQGLVHVFLVVLGNITTEHQRPSVGLCGMTLEFRAVHDGRNGDVVVVP